jgi:hypothetical protein
LNEALPFTSEVETAMYNECKEIGYIPPVWKTAIIKMLYSGSNHCKSLLVVSMTLQLGAEKPLNTQQLYW